MPIAVLGRRSLVPSFVAIVALAASACGQGSTEPGGPPAPLTALPRALTASEQKVLSASNAFSFALWQRLNTAQRDTSVFISPLSASFALGMTMNGGVGQTWDEMRSALQFGNASQQEINAGYKSLIALLTSLDPGVTMQVANSIWYRNSYTFRQSFFDTTRTYFDAEVRGLDFSNTAGSLATINGWVDSKTNHRIPTILDQIRPEDVMYLINAIYFKGSWRNKFDASQTRSDTFRGAAGSTQPVQLMHRLDSASYAEGASYQAVDLPYGRGAFTMTVVLPKAGTDIETFAASLNAGAWDAILAGLHTTKVDLSLPKLTMTYARELKPTLQALGMNIPFIGDVADFTGMSDGGHHLYIEFVKQKTFVAIDEEGTEAAAVTAVGVGVTSAPIIPVMKVDRPYVFVLRERLSGTILFMGKIVRMPT